MSMAMFVKICPTLYGFSQSQSLAVFLLLTSYEVGRILAWSKHGH